MHPAFVTIILSVFSASLIQAQHHGVDIPEVHPTLAWQKCTSLGSCTTQAGKIVLDANVRWYHNFYWNEGPCYEGTTWYYNLAPSEEAANEMCLLEGISSYADYGVTTSGNYLKLQFVSQSGSQYPTVGSKVYLLADDNTYATFKPLAQEITFDVDMSNLPCGIAADVHFSEMAADGGIVESNGWNNAGAKYGTGYCGAQCPRDVKWINGHVC